MTLLCLACTWLLLILLPWCLWVSLREGVSRLKQLHSIPCSRCAFFTGDYRLKCAVHPITAFTHDAIHCADYEPIVSPPDRSLCRPNVKCAGCRSVSKIAPDSVTIAYDSCNTV
ncbi:MAG: hypothetical protein RML75_10285 [Cyanobacteriota bacterium SKYGB_h_bin112]|nr:hypothetical protein [Cyanobacteriota bacterium SKYGB_h_bin112]